MTKLQPETAVPAGRWEEAAAAMPTEHPGAPIVVDVAMPVRSRVTYIGEAIEAVMAQTHPHWRLFVSDNGPGGGTVEEAVRPYLVDERITYAATGRPVALAENWTVALRAGTSPYVAILNDDDLWDPDFLARRVAALESEPTCGFAFSSHRVIDSHGDILVDMPFLFPAGVLSTPELALRLLDANRVPISAAVMRRSALERAGAWLDGQWVQCDWELWVRLALVSPAVFLPIRDNAYRRHAFQFSYERHAPVVERDAPIERYEALFDHLEGIVSAALPGLALGQRSRARANVLLLEASDAYEGGALTPALEFVRAAVAARPLSALDRRTLGIVGTLPFGVRGRAVFSRLRWSRWRRATRSSLLAKRRTTSG